ncbi:MAG: tRNA preQ1(34) S-adenosylmethionine ribosyltransferase-isomerase QueA [Thermodesulfobacteriota bacterium]
MPQDIKGDSAFSLASYDFELPPELIAQQPVATRHESRLLAYDTRSSAISDLVFRDVAELFAPGDLLVVNDTKVFPARLQGRKESGGKVELLLLEYPALPPRALAGRPGWQQVPALALLKSSRRPKLGSLLMFNEQLQARVGEVLAAGKVALTLYFKGGHLAEILERYGQLPLPPYIDRQQGEEPGDRQRYQTVYASKTGAVAAPTAGLHFSEELLARLRAKGVQQTAVTLHVGYGTFAPVRVADIRDHQIHSEYLTVSESTAALVNETREAGRRVWAVGTTTVRALEFAADSQGKVVARQGDCALYIYPGYRFKVVDNLITNFHLPRTSLLFLVSALAGEEGIKRCYEHAVAHRYRFFSYGDAMAIIGGRRRG